MSLQINLFLNALAADERAALMPHLSSKPLDQHQILFDIRDSVTEVHFPTDAVVWRGGYCAPPICMDAASCR